MADQARRLYPGDRVCELHAQALSGVRCEGQSSISQRKMRRSDRLGDAVPACYFGADDVGERGLDEPRPEADAHVATKDIHPSRCRRDAEGRACEPVDGTELKPKR